MTTMQRTLQCEADPRWCVVLDSDEVFPDDPGQGTPAMVNGPRALSATYHCALSETVLVDDGGRDVPIPAAVQRWLEDVEDEVSAFIDEATAEKEAKPARAPGIR
jgi:hypothetical protein